jgi:ppGpp synthetase/RelA/SpoT-type nucleotidyltranferase/formylmethanofuran dehydrogenase subunit E
MEARYEMDLCEACHSSPPNGEEIRAMVERALAENPRLPEPVVKRLAGDSLQMAADYDEAGRMTDHPMEQSIMAEYAQREAAHAESLYEMQSVGNPLIPLRPGRGGKHKSTVKCDACGRSVLASDAVSELHPPYGEYCAVCATAQFGDANPLTWVGPKKHRPDSNYDPTELARGIEVELEHAERDIAIEIAKDHLDEMDDYYTRFDECGLENPPFVPREGTTVTVTQGVTASVEVYVGEGHTRRPEQVTLTPGLTIRFIRASHRPGSQYWQVEITNVPGVGRIPGDVWLNPRWLKNRYFAQGPVTVPASLLMPPSGMPPMNRITVREVQSLTFGDYLEGQIQDGRYGDYTGSVGSLINNTITYKPETLSVLAEFKASDPWHGTVEERFAKFKECAHRLARIYGIERGFGINHTIRLPYTESGSSYYRPSAHSITLQGRFSVVTFLHEFGHSRGMGETLAQTWSINLFKEAFPERFVQIQFEANFLIATGQTQHRTLALIADRPDLTARIPLLTKTHPVVDEDTPRRQFEGALTLIWNRPGSEQESVLVSESDAKIRVYPFFGDMQGWIRQTYSGFDELIDYDIKEGGVRVPVYQARKFINTLTERYGTPNRVPFSYGTTPPWYAYEWIKDPSLAGQSSTVYDWENTIPEIGWSRGDPDRTKWPVHALMSEARTCILNDLTIPRAEMVYAEIQSRGLELPNVVSFAEQRRRQESGIHNPAQCDKCGNNQSDLYVRQSDGTVWCERCDYAKTHKIIHRENPNHPLAWAVKRHNDAMTALADGEIDVAERILRETANQLQSEGHHEVADDMIMVLNQEYEMGLKGPTRIRMKMVYRCNAAANTLHYWLMDHDNWLRDRDMLNNARLANPTPKLAIVDFDGTITATDVWPETSPPRQYAKEMLEELRDQGWKIHIITGQQPDAGIPEYLARHGIPYDELTTLPRIPKEIYKRQMYYDYKRNSMIAAMRKAGATPETTLVMDDRQQIIDMAQELGTHWIRISKDYDWMAVQVVFGEVQNPDDDLGDRLEKYAFENPDYDVVENPTKKEMRKYHGLFKDSDKDGLADVDTPGPYADEESKKERKVETIKLAEEMDGILKLRRKYERRLTHFVGKSPTVWKDGLTQILPKGIGELNYRAKKLFSIINKVRRKRLEGPKGLDDMAGACVTVKDYAELQVIKDIVEKKYGPLPVKKSPEDIKAEEKEKKKRILGDIVDYDDYYTTPKKDGYKACHYIIKHMGGPIELQVKTKRMGIIADRAHDAYKRDELNEDKMRYLTGLAELADKGDVLAAQEIDGIGEEEMKLMLKGTKKSNPAQNLGLMVTGPGEI